MKWNNVFAENICRLIHAKLPIDILDLNCWKIEFIEEFHQIEFTLMIIPTSYFWWFLFGTNKKKNDSFILIINNYWFYNKKKCSLNLWKVLSNQLVNMNINSIVSSVQWNHHRNQFSTLNPVLIILLNCFFLFLLFCFAFYLFFVSMKIEDDDVNVFVYVCNVFIILTIIVIITSSHLTKLSLVWIICLTYAILLIKNINSVEFSFFAF